jgi:hypothetical protein
MLDANRVEGPAKFFVENRVAHIVAVLGAAFSAVLFGGRGVRARGWKRAGWLALCALQLVQVAGLIWMRRAVNGPATKLAS